jgi:hypothetical protein
MLDQWSSVGVVTKSDERILWSKKRQWSLIGVLLFFAYSYISAGREKHDDFQLFLGTVMLVAIVATVLVRMAWVFEPGCIARRARVGLVWNWDWNYRGVQKIELRRGTWQSGMGRTFTLFFWDDCPHATAPEYCCADHDGRAIEVFAQDYEGADPAVTARFNAFGKMIADRVGVPFAVTEEEIPDPPASGE